MALAIVTAAGNGAPVKAAAGCTDGQDRSRLRYVDLNRRRGGREVSRVRRRELNREHLIIAGARSRPRPACR